MPKRFPRLHHPFASWFPPVFFAAVAIGTLPVVLTNLFVSSADAAGGFTFLAGGEYAAEQLAAFDRHPWLIHAHAVIGLTLVLAVPFQFWRGFRTRHRQAHRLIGYLSVTCLCTLAASGLGVAVAYPFAGVAGMVPNLVWMTAILFATAMAVRGIRRRDIIGHETWMTRAVAMTLGITFATIYLPVLTYVVHLPPRTALATSFWLGVVECLGIAELWLRRPGSPTARQREHRRAARLAA